MIVDVEHTRLLRRDSDTSTVPQGSIPRRRLKTVLYGVLGVSVLTTIIMFVPIKKQLVTINAWMEIHPIGGVALMPVLFTVAIPLAIPATILEVVSGSVFGIVEGTLMNAVGKVSGSLVAFLIGKRLGQQYLGPYLQTKFPVFSALSRVVEGPNWKPLLLLQLSSLPPVVKCYGLSITNVGLGRFALTSFVGGLPSALLWASIGHQTKTALKQETEGAGSRWIVMVIGLVCTVLAMGFLIVYTRRELHAHLYHASLPKKLHSTGDTGGEPIEDEDEETASEETVVGGEEEEEEEICEVVISQVAIVDTEQHLAKRISVG